MNFTTSQPLASVMAVDPLRRIALIVTQDGKNEWLPFAGTGSGMQGEGDFSLAPSGKGWRAIVENRQGGLGVITAFVDPGSFYADEEQLSASTESGGKTIDPYDSITASTNTYRAFTVDQDNIKKNFRNNKFFDTISGDHGYRGIDGNMHGVLRGGINISAVSRLNQIIQFLEDDLLCLVNRNYEHFTDWGVISIKNDKGKTTLSVKANSGDNSDFDTRKETYEFEMELGHANNVKEDSLFFTLIYKTKGGNEKLQITIDRKGEVIILAPTNIMVDVAENYGNSVGKKYTVKAGKEIDLTVGQQRLIIDPRGILAGTANEKTVVQSPHLDKYNAMNGDCFKAFIPLIAFGADPGAVFDIPMQRDETNKTEDVKLS